MRETYQPPTTSPAGPLHDYTIEETTLLPPSTKFDKTRQNPTKSCGNSCVRARARGNRVPFPFSLHGSESTYRPGVTIYRRRAANQTEPCSVSVA